MKNEFNELHRIFNSPEDELRYREKNGAFYKGIKDIIEKYDVPLSDVLTHPTGFMQRRNLPKFLALYDIFKMTIDMPGSIAEFGVFKGGSLFTWFHLLETFLPGERMKKIYAFDHFKGYDSFTDGESSSDWVKEKHNGNLLDDVSEGMIHDLVKLQSNDSYLPGVERIVLVSGDILETAPYFKENNMGVRFSIINVDVNLLKPVKSILDNFFDLLLPGGIIMFSGYSAAPWGGEAEAIEDYFLGKVGKFKKMHYSPYPRAYFIKGA
jgi:hypothetical protein